MRMTKKLISILLTLCMLMTVVSISFTSFAAVTDAQWNTLIAALKKDTVKTVTYSTSGNAVTINGAHPDVITALDAYVAVYNGSLTTGSDKTRAAAPRVTNAVNNSIRTTLNTKMGTDFTAYNVVSVITAFCGNIPVSDNETDNNNKLNAVTITVTVSLDEEYLLGSYESLEELLSASSVTKTYTYSFPNNDASYSTTSSSGCGGSTTTHHHYLLAAEASKKAGDAVDTAAISDFAAVVQTYGDMYGKTLAELVAMGSTALSTAQTAIKTPYDKVSSFINNKFFSEYNTAKLLTDIEDAITISQYTEIVAQTAELYATDYSAYTKDELLTLYTEFGEKLNAIYATNEVVKNYFGIDETYKTNNNAKLAEFKRAYQLCALREFKADTVDPAYATFVTYNEDDLIKDKEDFVVTDNTITKADVVNAKGLIDGYIEAFDSYDAANVLEVFGQDSLDALDALSEALADLIVIADADIAYAAKIAEFVNTVYAAVDLDDTDEALLDQVKAYDGWFTNLKAFEADYVTTYGEETANKIFDGLDKAMNDKLTEKYAVLEARMKAQVDVAWLLLDEAKVAYGGEVTIVSIETFGKLYKAVGALNKDLADFLKATSNYDLDETIEAEYDELCEVVFDDYNEFLESGGYDKYVTTTYADITRTVADGEEIRNADYVVDDEKLEAIIDLIDEALNSKEIKALLAEEGEEEGDIADKLHSLISDAVFSDSLINTLASFLYPTIANEFVKIWADLPTDLAGMDVGGVTTIKSGTLSVISVEKAVGKVGLNFFPVNLAPVLEDNYPEAAEKLALATTPAKYDKENDVLTTPWEDEAICDEEGNLDLYWGVDDAEDKEAAFLDAACAALSGLEPLFITLLTNKDFSVKNVTGIGTGTATLQLLSIGLSVKDIKLSLTAEANPGYNNVIIPILEMLGVDAANIPDGNDFTSLRDIIKLGLIDPVAAFIDQLGAAPADVLLQALPNLAYNMQAGRIIPLLSMLKSNINYSAGIADYQLNGLASLLQGIVNAIAGGALDSVISDSVAIDVGEMIDFDDLGVDLSSLNGLLGMVGGLLGEGITLPAMDGGVLASLGTLTQIPTKRDHKTYAWGDADKAAYIEANRADVLLFLFDYVIEALKAQPTIIEDIVNTIQASKAEEEAAAAAEAGEEYIAPEPFVMPEEVTAILNNVLNGYNKAENKFDALAALAELIFPVEYTTTADELVYDSTALDPDYMITDLHTGETKVVFDSDVEYTEWWTEEKAQYVADNLQSFIDNIIMMFGVKIGDVKVESLSETVTELVNSLYAPETVTELAATLAGLLDGLEIEDDLKALLMGIIADNLGDISVWDGYEADFEAGDKDGFVAAMTEVLAPVEKVLQFILTDENLTVSLNGADGKFQVIELPGYMGYTYGLIPLFEALGAEDVMDTDAFAADKDNIIANLLNTLTGIVDTVAADPYAAIENILPNLLYFVESDGIQVAIDNLLYPVDQALEVIAPIYKVNLNELLPFDIRFAGIDPVAFLFTELEAMAYEATGIDFNFDFTAAELLNDLTFGEMLTYTSATGKEAYKVAPGALTADMVTQVLRFLLEEAMFSDNMSSLINWARVTYELPDEIYYPLYAFFYGLFTMKDTHIDYALGIAYYAFFGANTAVEAVADYYQYMRYDWQAIAEQLKDEDMTDLEKAAYIFKEIYNTTGMTILDSLYEQGKSPISSGFFAKIKEMIRAYIELFKTIFSGLSQIGK